jgi:CrcB-like protein, Camphor Resistance (CrcB)
VSPLNCFGRSKQNPSSRAHLRKTALTTAWRNDAIATGITTGFCGAYTTFSGWTVRTDELIVSEQPKALSQQPQIAGIMYVAGGIAVFFASRTVGADLGALVPAASAASLQKRCTEVSTWRGHS